MGMTHEEAIRKVAKLLRLAQSDNPHEAALAAARAQDIIDRHKLTDMSLVGDGQGARPEEPVRDFGAAPLDSGATIATWKWRLADALMKANQCRGYVKQFFSNASLKGIAIVGRASDAETVRYLYSWLSAEVDRLAERDGAGMGRTWRNNFRIGVVQTISERLREQRELTRAEVKADAITTGASAIVRVDRALARIEREDRATEEWVTANLKLVTTRGSGFRGDHSAREAGRAAGREIKIGGARATMGPGQRALAAGES